MNPQPEDVQVALITAIASIVTGILTWTIGRRKNKAGLVGDLETRLKRQDTNLGKMTTHIEKLELLLLKNEVVTHKDLEAIRNNIFNQTTE